MDDPKNDESEETGMPALNLPKSELYDRQLMEYVNHTMTDVEKRVYNTFFNAIRERNQIHEPGELMMLDMAVHDFIRIKRIQALIYEEGESFKVVMKNGVQKSKVAESAYLLNTVESQFRNSMTSLGLTRKDGLRMNKTKATGNFLDILQAKPVVEAELKGDGEVDIRRDDTKPGTGTCIKT